MSAYTSPVRTTDDDTQVWRITWSQQLDVPDDQNDDIDFATDMETLPHTERMDVIDWVASYQNRNGYTLDDTEWDDDGNLIRLEISYFDSYFDRSSEESYPTWERVIWELESFG